LIDFVFCRKEAAGDAAKHAKKTAENVAEQATSKDSLLFF